VSRAARKTLGCGCHSGKEEGAQAESDDPPGAGVGRCGGRVADSVGINFRGPVVVDGLPDEVQDASCAAIRR
jgi:hypothetical protein